MKTTKKEVANKELKALNDKLKQLITRLKRNNNIADYGIDALLEDRYIMFIETDGGLDDYMEDLINKSERSIMQSKEYVHGNYDWKADHYSKPYWVIHFIIK